MLRIQLWITKIAKYKSNILDFRLVLFSNYPWTTLLENKAVSNKLTE